MEKTSAPLNPPTPSVRPRTWLWRRQLITLTGITLALLATLWLHFDNTQQVFKHGHSVAQKVQQCSIDNLHKHLSFLDPAKPITADEFLDRRDRLAQALAASDIDAFVLEPGYTFQYEDSALRVIPFTIADY